VLSAVAVVSRLHVVGSDRHYCFDKHTNTVDILKHLFTSLMRNVYNECIVCNCSSATFCVWQVMGDENDPVVCERTVMLSRKLCDHLLLLQYPVRSAERTYDKAHVLATRVKPKQQSVELEVALDTKSCHYSVTGARDTGCMDRRVCSWELMLIIGPVALTPVKFNCNLTC